MRPGKRTASILCLTWSVFSCDEGVATPSAKAITCPITKDVSLKFDIPAKLGDLPQIDFSYPSKVTIFSFRDRNFLAIAVDDADPSRIRIVLSKGQGYL
jgi:hypothetical protein